MKNRNSEFNIIKLLRQLSRYRHSRLSGILLDSPERCRTSRHDSYEVLENNKGVALVMVLILAAISLAIISALLFMATQGTIISGSQKFYKTAKEASLGGAEISTAYMSDRGELALAMITTPAGGFGDGCSCGDPTVTTDNTEISDGTVSCRCDKLCNATADWTNLCDENAGGFTSLNPVNPLTRLAADSNGNTAYDFKFTFAGSGFEAYAKIVDTVLGNSDVGGIVASGELGGAGVVSSTAGVVNPPASPYLYRLEVQAQDATNPREVSRVSILYGF